MNKMSKYKENYLSSLQYDLPSGVVVFLIAIPLCLGIALASGAPFLSGIIAGVIGGIIVPLISKSQVSVSGPAAGLTSIVFFAISDIGNFNGFLMALILAGLIQIVLGSIRAGAIAYFIPSSVIKGMLAAIGLILILKQLPHAIGYDVEIFEDDKFSVNENENTFTLLLHAFNSIEWGAFIISSISLCILIGWEKTSLKKIHWLPSALAAVCAGILINWLLGIYQPELQLEASHLVTLPVIKDLTGFLNGIHTPDWTYILNKKVWLQALIIGFVASIETLLTMEALEKLDPYKRKVSLNRELVAQGVGNTFSGLIGGIPLTSVIVRSSAGINAGGRTKTFVIFHGILLLVASVFFAYYLNYIPLSSLAALLLIVGYKLARPSIFIENYKKGWTQFAPFVITVLAILFTDLLIGVSIGLMAGIYFVILSNFSTALMVTKDKDDKHILIKFKKDVTFLNKKLLMEILMDIEENSFVIIDGTKAHFIDNDILELLSEFIKEAMLKNIHLEFKSIPIHFLHNKIEAETSVI